MDDLSESGCVFCERIERGEYDRTENDKVVSFEPLDPIAHGHRLFVPVKHLRDAISSPEYYGVVQCEAAKWAMGYTCDFNLITSSGRHASQTIFHLHVHAVPRLLDDGLQLPWTAQQKHQDEDKGRLWPVVGLERTRESYGHRITEWINANGGYAQYQIGDGKIVGTGYDESLPSPVIRIRTRGSFAYAQMGDTIVMGDDVFEVEDSFDLDDYRTVEVREFTVRKASS